MNRNRVVVCMCVNIFRFAAEALFVTIINTEVVQQNYQTVFSFSSDFLYR